MFKTLTVATIAAVMATSAFAGSVQAPVVEQEPEEGVFVPATGSGIGAPAVVGGVLAAVAIAALVSNNDDDDDGAVDGHGSSAVAD